MSGREAQLVPSEHKQSKSATVLSTRSGDERRRRRKGDGTANQALWNTMRICFHKKPEPPCGWLWLEVFDYKAYAIISGCAPTVKRRRPSSRQA